MERDIVMTGRDAQGNETIDLPVTRLGLLEGAAEVKEAMAETDYIPLVVGQKVMKVPASALLRVIANATKSLVPNTRKINDKPLSADVTLTAADVGARAADWMPSASDVGALPDTEAVPILKGGTGATAAAAAIYNLVNALTALSNTGLATGDYLPLLDASAAIGKKVTLSNLKTWLQSQNIGARIATGSYTGTGTAGPDNPTTITFPFKPKYVIVTSNESETNGKAFGRFYNNDTNGCTIDCSELSSTYSQHTTVSSSRVTYVRLVDNTLQLYSQGDTVYVLATMQINRSGCVYHYIAII